MLDHLGELGVDRVTDVLLTHHHRDQLGGLRRAVGRGHPHLGAAGRRRADRGRDRSLAARVRSTTTTTCGEDRFSLLESVPVTGTVAEYRTTRYGGIDVFTLPTPGHTPGSVTYLVEADGRKLAFTGDLVYGDGKVWSLAATQWSYSGVEGQAATIVSCATLAALEPGRPAARRTASRSRTRPARSRASRARLGELVDLRLGEPSGPRGPAREAVRGRSRRTCCATARRFASSYAAALGERRRALHRLRLRPMAADTSAPAAARRARCDTASTLEAVVVDALPRRPRRRAQPAARRRGDARSGRRSTSRPCSRTRSASTCRASGSSRSASTARCRSGRRSLARVRADASIRCPGHTLYACGDRVRGRRPPRPRDRRPVLRRRDV